MATFFYKAIDAEGKLVKGSIEGADSVTVSDNIISLGLYIVSLRKSNSYAAIIAKKISIRNIKRTDIIEFSSNLSVMLGAGIPIITAFSDLAKTINNSYFKQIINDIRREVELGSSLSDAVKKYGDIFPDIFLRLAVVGEQTGHLDKSLSDVATHLQRVEDLSAAIKKAMLYPVFAIVATFGALIFWLVFVLPQMMDLFLNMGVELPATTKGLFWLSAFCRTYWYLLIFLPILLIVAIKFSRRYQKFRYYTDMALIKFPVVKHVIYNKLLALFSEQAMILTKAGITVDKSYSIISDVIGNEVFKQAIDSIKEEVTAGSLLSEAIIKQPVFPPLVTRMIDIGETTGTLDKQYDYLSTYYHKHLDNVTQKIGTLIEPIVLGTIGLIFAFIIASLLLPIYDLVANIDV